MLLGKNMLADELKFFWLLVQCFEVLRDNLAAYKPSINPQIPGADAKQEWYSFTLACLRAFTRFYHATAAPLAKTLEAGIFSAENASTEIRQAFAESLHI